MNWFQWIYVLQYAQAALLAVVVLLLILILAVLDKIYRALR